MIFNMKRGRPSTTPRCDFGRRLFEAREEAGMSQVQLAEKLGVLQRTVAYWERRPSSLRPDQIIAIAKVLNISVEKLLYKYPPSTEASRGPTGKVKMTFQEVAQLPKREQKKIVEVVEALVIQAKTDR